MERLNNYHTWKLDKVVLLVAPVLAPSLCKIHDLDNPPLYIACDKLGATKGMVVWNIDTKLIVTLTLLSDASIYDSYRDSYYKKKTI